MKVRKQLALLLALLLVFGFAACNSSEKEQEETSTPAESSAENLPEPYTIKYLTAGEGGKQADSEKVLALANTKLQELMPNTTLDFEVVPFSEYAEKWQLAAAAAEKIDIAWMGWMLSLQNEVNNGSFLQLDEPLEKYAPELKKQFLDWIWDGCKVAGKTYAIPVGLGWAKVPNGVYFPTELADKYLDVEAYKKAVTEWEKSGSRYPTEGFLDVVESYLAKAKAGGDLNKGIQNVGMGLSWFETPDGAAAYCKAEDETSKAYSILDEDYSYYFERMGKWYKEGYIRKDVLTTMTDSSPIDSLKITDGSYKDKVIAEIGQVEDMTEMNVETRWGMDATILPVRSYTLAPVGKHGTATSIPRTCGNIERTMQFVQLLWSEKGADIIDILAYGIEGEHYSVVTDRVPGVKGKIIKTFEYDGVSGGKADNKYGVPYWTIGYGRYAALNQGYNTTMVEDRMKEDEAAKAVPLTGFQYDTSEVKLEQAQFKAIWTEYERGLNCGTYKDPAAAYKEMRERMEAAGVRKIATDLQKQIDEFMATK